LLPTTSLNFTSYTTTDKSSSFLEFNSTNG
jgi:hypothetical protein